MDVSQVNSVEPQVLTEPETVTPQNPSFEEPSKIVKPTKKGPLVGILIFLILCLILGLAYYVLKDNGVDLLALGKQTDTTSESNDDVDTNTSTDIEAGSDSTTCKDAGTTNCEVKVDNEGWGLFSIPKYNFAMEVPPYRPTLKLGGEDVPYEWNYNSYILFFGTELDLLNNYLRTINASFYPTRIPESVACGGFCVNEHRFDINIYANIEHKTLSQISALYSANWPKVFNYDENISITGSNSTKWGRNVWKYTTQFIEYSMEGYIVVTNDYIYDISYHINETPAESQGYGLKVLDSMKFED